MSDLPSNPAESSGPALPSKPALAPGVKSQVKLPNADRPTGPGLASGPARFDPGLKPSFGAPKPRLRAVEPSPVPAAASYKVSVPETTQSAGIFPVSHAIASGLSAAVAVASTFLLFLKY